MGFSIAGVADAATTTRAKPNVGTRFKQQIKKAEEVLQESYMMIPDSKNRFQKSLEVSYQSQRLLLLVSFC